STGAAMLTRRIGSSVFIFAVSMGAAPLVTTAAPQEQPGTTGATGPLITEVVVTARKRGEERLQDIPTAISAFSEQMLADLGVSQFTDFAYHVPGLTFNDTGAGEK